MTIIRNTTYLSKYPFRCLEQALVDELLSYRVLNRRGKEAKYSREPGLKLFECYCHLTNTTILKSDLAKRDIQEVILGFFHTLKGESFTSTSVDHRRLTFELIRGTFIEAFRSHRGNSCEWLENADWFSLEAKNFDLNELDTTTLRYWSGWPILSRKNKETYLEFAPLYHSHGDVFTLQFYKQWRSVYEKQARPHYQEANKFARFLARNKALWPASTFENPIKFSNCLKDYLKAYFIEAQQDGANLNSRIKSWNRFIANLDEAFIQPNVWPEPFGSGLPRLSERNIVGSKVRVSKNEKGFEVFNKLITEVPLNYTDDQAIEVLFKQIDKDLSTVKNWAQSRIWDLRKRQLRRKALARKGDPYAMPLTVRSERRLNDFELPNICAKFEHFGFFHSGSDNPDLDLNKIYGWHLPKFELAKNLGIPIADTLFPFMCFLILENPIITHAFIAEFELYNKHGQASGFVKTDAGYQLSGYKDRRKKHLSEQKILLSPRSAVIVRQLIQITQPLREYLKSRGDDNWRKLFLTSGRGFSYPIAGRVATWRSAKHDDTANFVEFEEQFSKYTTLKGEGLRKFLHRVSLASLRASRGVQIYLETKSVHEMAKALGHAKYSPKLLSHYLPDSILAFFQTRWVRLFQKAFICEAMKDSPYLLRATAFESMDELHEFLKNHALKDIPAHLSNPENTLNVSESSDDQVLISIDTGILTALLSVNRAVEQSQKQEQISGLARYWSNISGLIEKEISQGNDFLLKQHLESAIDNLDPIKMETLIYDFAA